MKKIEDLQEEKFIYLTTRGRKSGKPHTVELWFAIAGGKVYLSHEGDRTDWMKNLVGHGSVSVRVDGATYKGDARIAEGAARETGKKALYEKYYGRASNEVIDDWFSLSTVVEVTPAT